MNDAHRNLFSDLGANFVDNAVLSDSWHLLQPKSEHKHICDSAASVDARCQEQTGCDASNPDNVQPVIVRLPLIPRLRQFKDKMPVPYIKTEITDAVEGSTAADEPAAQPTVAESQTTEEAEMDIKKDMTAAAKGLQLARETIANIFGTEFQPPSTMKIPIIKRRTEKDADDCNDAKRSRTCRSDDIHDRSSNIQHSWYVLE